VGHPPERLAGSEDKNRGKYLPRIIVQFNCWRRSGLFRFRASVRRKGWKKLTLRLARKDRDRWPLLRVANEDHLEIYFFLLFPVVLLFCLLLSFLEDDFVSTFPPARVEDFVFLLAPFVNTLPPAMVFLLCLV